jgi:hypothetical protein
MESGNTWNAKLEMWVEKDYPKQRTIFPNKLQACKTLDNHMSKQKAWHAKSGPNSTQGFSLICSMHEITTSSDAPNPGGPYMQQIIMTWVCASQASITITTNHFPEDKHHTGRIDESLLWINLMNPTCWAWLLESRYVQSCHLGQIKFYFMSPRRREKYPLPSIMHPLNKSQTKSC